jgi:hypothetical protein
MARDLSKQDGNGLVSVNGVDLKQVFASQGFEGGLVHVPKSFHSLPDFRPLSETRLELALRGRAPKSEPLPHFDPLLGPFSLPDAGSNSWAESLDFLRDIKGASIGPIDLSQAWITQWLSAKSPPEQKGTLLFSSKHEISSKTNRLIWRARRILNCLSHILPITSRFEENIQAEFWHQLINDIAKICAPTNTLWESLTDGFNPLSRQAVWLRAVAILSVEAAFPGYLRSQLVLKSLEQIKASIQGDGLMVGGSIVATLSGGADLCMLARIGDIDPILNLIRGALVCLRLSDGSLISFGAASGDHGRLLCAVLGPGDWKPSNLLLGSGIGRMACQKTVVWMRAPQSGRTNGATCEVEVGGCSLLTSYPNQPTALVCQSPATLTKSRCKRRDEPEFCVLEASAEFSISGRQYASIRQIRINQSGTVISGEDVIRPGATSQINDVSELRFVISDSCTCYLSKDHCSVLIVTSQQQAWRFRVQAMDITVEMGFGEASGSEFIGGRNVIVCTYPDIYRKSDFTANWQLVLEE